MQRLGVGLELKTTAQDAMASAPLFLWVVEGTKKKMEKEKKRREREKEEEREREKILVEVLMTISETQLVPNNCDEAG